MVLFLLKVAGQGSVAAPRAEFFMATHYDLQEQEQLATLKHFWGRWGTLISLVVLAVVLVFAGYSGYRYWQARQASQAAVLLEQVRLGAEQTQSEQVSQSLQVLQSNFARTAQASQGALVAGAYFAQQQQWDAAQQAFDWVSSQSRDEGFKALGALHKASVQIEQGQLDAALATLDGHSFPYEFQALRDDRRGDILRQQGRLPEAIAAYNAAFEAFDPFTAYRSVVEAKLNALGQRPALLGQAGA